MATGTTKDEVAARRTSRSRASKAADKTDQLQSTDDALAAVDAAIAITDAEIKASDEAPATVTPEEARQHVDAAKEGVQNFYADTLPLIRQIRNNEEWRELESDTGTKMYASWEECVTAEFGSLPRMSVEDRRSLATALSGEGWSTREMAPVLGVSHASAAADIKADAQKDEPSGKNITDGPVTNPKPRGASPKCQANMSGGRWPAKCKIPKSWDSAYEMPDGSLGGWVTHSGVHETDPAPTTSTRQPATQPTIRWEPTVGKRGLSVSQAIKAAENLATALTDLRVPEAAEKWSETEREEAADKYADTGAVMLAIAEQLRK